MIINFEPTVPHVILLLMEKDGELHVAAIEERSPSGVKTDRWGGRYYVEQVYSEMRRKSGLNPESQVYPGYYLGTYLGGDSESSRHFMALMVDENEVDWDRRKFRRGTFVPQRGDQYRDVRDPEIHRLDGFSTSSGYVMAAIGLLQPVLYWRNKYHEWPTPGEEEEES